MILSATMPTLGNLGAGGPHALDARNVMVSPYAKVGVRSVFQKVGEKNVLTPNAKDALNAIPSEFVKTFARLTQSLGVKSVLGKIVRAAHNVIKFCKIILVK